MIYKTYFFILLNTNSKFTQYFAIFNCFLQTFVTVTFTPPCSGRNYPEAFIFVLKGRNTRSPTLLSAGTRMERERIVTKEQKKGCIAYYDTPPESFIVYSILQERTYSVESLFPIF